MPLPEYDLVARNATGGLELRWARLDGTLDAFLAAGVRPDPIVLDNVPYAFVAKPTFCSYGQASAPDDPAEFAWFVEQLVRHLVARYGPANVSTWRFRLGTEANGPRLGPPWTQGGLPVYENLYVPVAQAVKRALPTAQIGPSNFAAIGTSGCDDCPHLSLFAKHMAERNASVDFWALSDYSHEGPAGSAPAQLQCDAAAGLAHAVAGAGLPAVPHEVHEFGWAAWLPFADKSPWPVGVFGAAWTAAAWLWYGTCNISRVFHWGYYTDPALAHHNRTATGDNPLLAGGGFLMAAAEALVGLPDVAQFAQLVSDADVQNATVGGWRGADPAAELLSYLLVAHTPDYLQAPDPVRWSITVTAADFPQQRPFWPLASVGQPGGPAVTVRVLNRTTSVHDVMLADLKRLGGHPTMLVRNDSSVSLLDTMATPAGLAALAARAASYMELNAAALRSTLCACATASAAAATIELTTSLPAVVLLQVGIPDA